MIYRSFFILILLVTLHSQPTEDLVSDPPGMPNASKIYSGYLDTLSESRKLHYIFVQSQSSPQSDPVILWLGGGPGCSSLIGFLKQIGPYIIGNSYTNNTNLTRNPYAWSRNANLFFVESPAGVGFSINPDHNYIHNDTTSTNDLYAALKYFLGGKGSPWKQNRLYVAGQDYAGKFIPDLVLKILNNNADFYINITGILVGNGIMYPHEHEMEKHTIEYMHKHNFINPTMMSMFKQSCEADYNSPRCNLFKIQYFNSMNRINPYNVYDVCRPHPDPQTDSDLKAISECFSFEGMSEYLNLHRQKFNIKEHIRWTYCAPLFHYYKNPQGSLQQYKSIILNKRVKIWMYNGDSDNTVPIEDTFKNLPKIGAYEVGSWNPWKKGKHHAGFYIHYSNVLVVSVKGAGSMVIMDQREAAYQMFYNFINNREIDEVIE